MGSRSPRSWGAALAVEKDRKVRDTLEKLYAVHREAAELERARQWHVTLPPIDMPQGILALPQGFAQRFEATLTAALPTFQQQYKLELQRHALQSGSTKIAAVPPALPTPAELSALYSYIEGTSSVKPEVGPWLFKAFEQIPDIDHCVNHDKCT